jgi:hypothetical protein
MKKLLLFLFTALLFAQCGSREKLPQGAPPKLKTDDLQAAVLKAENAVAQFGFKASARLESPTLNQSFRLEVRLLQDSLIWLDFADPILGIKAARAVLYKDSVAFVNRLERTYLTGSIADFQRTFKVAYTFYDLQAILLGNLVLKDFEQYKQYPMAGYYQLANFEQNPAEQHSTPASQEQFVTLQFLPGNYKPAMQELNEPVNGKRYTLFYEDFSTQGTGQFPQRVKVEYAGDGLSTLEINVQQFSLHEPLNFPFSIPSGYARIR